MVIYCDIDSTINNHWVRIENKLESIEKNIMLDLVLPHAVECVNKLNDRFDFNFLSARYYHDAYEITLKWLIKNEFNFKTLRLVESMDCKYNFLRYNRCDIYIDDFTSGQERGQKNLTYRTDLIKIIRELGIEVFVFNNNWPNINKNNWPEICNKILTY
jgi:uncharacterized HAD superfamily protein